MNMEDSRLHSRQDEPVVPAQKKLSQIGEVRLEDLTLEELKALRTSAMAHMSDSSTDWADTRNVDEIERLIEEKGGEKFLLH